MFAFAQVCHHAPGGFVGKSIGADFSGLDEFVQRGDGFCQWGEVGRVIQRAHAEAAEVIDAPLRPVQLVEVEVVGVQAGERGVAGGVDLRAGEARTAANVVLAVIAARGAGDFAGEDDVIAFAAALQPTAEVLFGAGVGLAPRRHGVHFGGVDEVHAPLKGVIELCVRLGLAVLLAEGHGAKADDADVNAGLAKFAVLHGVLRKSAYLTIARGKCNAPR